MLDLRFGVMGAIEGMNKIQSGQEVILSEQQLVECDDDGIDDGCNCGLTDYAFKYLTGKEGLVDTCLIPMSLEIVVTKTAADGLCLWCDSQRIPHSSGDGFMEPGR